ncbi:MAG TPA: signal peptidase I [Gaiellaceae bacterium]|nr:signal peptidase I [Gaiellaceae bacterium]
MRISVALPPEAGVGPRLPYARKIALIGVQLALVGTLGWYCLPQRLGGRAAWVMVSGTSMLPRFHTGDLVLVEHQSSYHVGEIVAYRVPKGQVGTGFVVIHRIIGGNGRTGWRMKGDNRTAPDLWYPTDHDVIGSKLLRIPHAWFFIRLLHMPLILGLVAGFAAFFAIAFADVSENENDDDDDTPAAAEEHV